VKNSFNKPTNVALSLGSNVGDSKNTIKESIAELSQVVSDMKVSSLYRTEPVQMRYQPDFINAAVVGKTDISPIALLRYINIVEKKFGRVREIKFGPRTLDIDIIFFGDAILDEDRIRIPHPEFRKRLFVLIPLCEICPDLKDPETGKRICEILEEAKKKFRDSVEKI